jgi:hypothetical protein
MHIITIVRARRRYDRPKFLQRYRRSKSKTGMIPAGNTLQSLPLLFFSKRINSLPKELSSLQKNNFQLEKNNFTLTPKK